MSTERTHQQLDKGTIKVADEVVSVIAGLAAMEVAGVAGMGGGGFVGGVSEMLGRRNLSKGVKVTVVERTVTVDLNVIVDFGVLIPQVAASVQDNVRKAIENMTGLKVQEVNVHVHGVHFPAEKSDDHSKVKETK